VSLKACESRPFGEQACTIAFAIRAVVKYASLSSVQLRSASSQVKIDTITSPFLVAMAATSLRTASNAPVLLAIAE